jgi:hypothetical protein
MTIPGVDMVVALAIAIGEAGRSTNPIWTAPP